MARTGPGWGQEQAASSESPIWMLGTKEWGHLLLLFSRPLSGNCIESGQTGLQLVPLWDVRVVHSTITHCATVPRQLQTYQNTLELIPKNTFTKRRYYNLHFRWGNWAVSFVGYSSISFNSLIIKSFGALMHKNPLLEALDRYRVERLEPIITEYSSTIRLSWYMSHLQLITSLWGRQINEWGTWGTKRGWNLPQVTYAVGN